MRTCSQCGGEDREIPTPDGAEHWVVPELRWLPAGQTEISPRDGRAGWRVRMVQARRAMERLICRDCLAANFDRDRLWAGLRKAARKAEQKPGDSYILALCE